MQAETQTDNKKQPKCSIIIRAYNEEKHIGKLLSGIMEQEGVGELEIILVDSGSTDATCNIAANFPVKVIPILPKDFSFGYALNVGCKAATGEFLIFASAHVYPVYKDWLSQMIRLFEEEKVALVYGKQRGNEITKYSEQQVFRKWFPEDSDFRQRHPFCNNANAAIRKELWEAYPYDETLTGLEDLDWAKRVLAAGYFLAYNAQAEIIHVHEETPAKVKNRYRREAIALKRIFPEEKFGFRSFVQMFLGNAISDSWHALGKGVFLKEVADIWQFRFMQFWGTFLGYRDGREIHKELRERFYYPNKLEKSAPSVDSRSDLKIDYSTSE